MGEDSVTCPVALARLLMSFFVAHLDLFRKIVRHENLDRFSSLIPFVVNPKTFKKDRVFYLGGGG